MLDISQMIISVGKKVLAHAIAARGQRGTPRSARGASEIPWIDRQRSGTARPFPLWRLLAARLRCPSIHWTGSIGEAG
jgi:hypothetical protein